MMKLTRFLSAASQMHVLKHSLELQAVAFAHCPRPKSAIRYFETNVLDYHEKVEDGFYFPMIKHRAYSTLPTLQYLVKNSGGYRDQEIVVVDANTDHELRDFVEKCLEDIAPIKDEREKIVALSNMVDDFMGRSSEDVEEYFEAQAVNAVLYLGEIECGVCRHRSVLFKYIADRAGLSVRLLRGEYWHTVPQAAEEDSTFVTYGYHVWNSVLIGGKQYICDVCRFPGKLYEEDSEVAQRYHHHEKHSFRDIRLGSAFSNLPVPKF